MLRLNDVSRGDGDFDFEQERPGSHLGRRCTIWSRDRPEVPRAQGPGRGQAHRHPGLQHQGLIDLLID